MTDRSLLLVHAHPDDETIGTGATMAKYAAEGVHVTLVTCTLGEEGEVLVPALAELAADKADQLGGWRIHELEEACKALGVQDHRFLGAPGRYRDSGMMDTPANDNPRCFWRADLDEAAEHLIEVIREVRPQVVVTYDDFGAYGHPDHIQAHRVTVRAVEQTRDIVKKLYSTTIPRSFIEQSIEAMKDSGQSFFEGVESADDVPFAKRDDEITAQIDARDFLDAKVDAMRAHASQIEVDGPFFALSNNMGQKAFGLEHYVLMEGERGPGSPDSEYNWEPDLFAGL
ncbi:MAG: N-acetyl-D-myo-inositol-2-amino-2-deoxy-alpha-D-glucopyranoside deacetylase [Actinomycetota bacterium]|jgi:N-acetyl-1-D-myo-inositol-2-amino-2-deoxy-alpha-D-glucopyranoside deacetylase|nr:N-acetyl-D-myo-inositol-2-amino-2-deoxy-alpha-D-glucopyranoside deacetylase [Actinomycetota bacterium]